MSNNISVKKMNIKKIMGDIVIILCILPFVQTGYQIFVPFINNITTIWKIVVVISSIFLCISSSKKVDKLLVMAILCNGYMAIPTYINNGYFVKFFGYLIDSVGLLFVIKNLLYRYSNIFLQSIKRFCRIMIYINFVLLILFPSGIFVEDNGYLVTRYLFLGMDNQAAIMLITFMLIIYAIEKKQYKKLRIAFLIDIIVFVISMFLIWCGTSIVGIFVFIGALIYQKILKKKITVYDCVKVLVILFVFVILLHGFNFFSKFIIDFLGKDMTLSGRTLIWENGINEWLKYPILGHGYQVSEAFITFDGVSDYVRGAHNQILNFLLHGGIIYLIAYFSIFYIVHKTTKQYKENSSVNILILCILVNFVMWTSDTYGHIVGMYLLIGILCYGNNLLIEEEERNEK